ncbi:MAG: hypothetical protein LDL30_01055 [Desulfovibrio sp.]|nr:hypothetical protein [Desulfovibrio sp.]MCA1986226.1 hypothetical protein [Desulfovibrio sp.]
MTSPILAALTLALTLAASGPAAAQGTVQATTQAQQAQWNEWIAARIKQSWIDMYAAEKNLDPARVTWEDLPVELRARFAQAFGASAAK